MARRGSYAKGIAKREEILHAALAVVAREGYHGASVKELAEAVGLSQAGLLHYFDSKDELFVEILRTRDEVDMAGHLGAARAADLDEMRDGYLDIVRHNARVPGLVELFTRLAADAANPEHPSRAFFAERGAGLRDRWAGTIADAQAEGRIRSGIDPMLAARLLQAVSDGAQMQLLVEPELDMTALIETLFDLMQAPAPDSVEQPRGR
ncbi:TetR/AcrR family transcriptional regulator [Microbacterium sp. 2MCAF23]|uniref:TetR/AcrR family transcriptional regulator n=1 Tax=Microbacterium sp. 2MCAF23 TaxID=3232985 RepID=UPI003F95F4D0